MKNSSPMEIFEIISPLQSLLLVFTLPLLAFCSFWAISGIPFMLVSAAAVSNFYLDFWIMIVFYGAISRLIIFVYQSLSEDIYGANLERRCKKMVKKYPHLKAAGERRSMVFVIRKKRKLREKRNSGFSPIFSLVMVCSTLLTIAMGSFLPFLVYVGAILFVFATICLISIEDIQVVLAKIIDRVKNENAESEGDLDAHGDASTRPEPRLTLSFLKKDFLPLLGLILDLSWTNFIRNSIATVSVLIMSSFYAGAVTANARLNSDQAVISFVSGDKLCALIIAEVDEKIFVQNGAEVIEVIWTRNLNKIVFEDGDCKNTDHDMDGRP